MGIPVGAGTDATRVSSYNPWISLFWLVSGKTVGGLSLYDQDNCLDRVAALRLYTEGSSWFSGDSGHKGRIALGQLADIVTLSDDYFSVPENEIKEIESVLTIMDGRVVHGAGDYAGLAPPLPPVSPGWAPQAFMAVYIVIFNTSSKEIIPRRHSHAVRLFISIPIRFLAQIGGGLAAHALHSDKIHQPLPRRDVLMSDLLKDIGHCRVESCQCPAIHTILHPKDRDLGSFSVRRLLPAETMKSVGPFVFFDHLGPAKFPPGQGIDVRPHPHIGLATITYLFEGEILHRDSLGHVQAIRPGEINWMTAGRGIVHSERTPPALRSEGHQVHALQLWVALPDEFEEVSPAFSHYATDQLPTLHRDDLSIRVMIGEAYGVASPVETFSPTIYLEIQAKAGAKLTLPEEVEELGVYLIRGSLQARETIISPHTLAVLSSGSGITFIAKEDSQLVVIGGKSLGKRTVWWNLVATRKELIERAKAEWRAGHFPKVPGETEFIPLPGD